MNRFLLILVLFSLLVFQSCSYFGTYEYTVYNELNDTLIIKLDKSYWYVNEQKDTVIKIAPLNSRLILSTPTEELSKDEQPTGEKNTYIDDFTKLDFYYKNIKIDKDFRELKFWNYSNEADQIGVYELHVDSTLIK